MNPGQEVLRFTLREHCFLGSILWNVSLGMAVPRGVLHKDSQEIRSTGKVFGAQHLLSFPGYVTFQFPVTDNLWIDARETLRNTASN